MSALKHDQTNDKMNVALCTFLHVAIYIVSFFYYGSHPTVVIQTNPGGGEPLIKIENIPGMVVVSGTLTLVGIPLVVEFFEFKRKNANFWGNLAANQCNALTCIPTEMLCLPWMCTRMTPPGENWAQILQDTVIYLMMADLWFYVTHRITHENAFLWRFHVLHHNLNPAKSVTAIAAASTSAIDFTITHLPMLWWPFLVRTFCFEAVCFSLVFMITWLTFIHSYSFWSYDSRVMMDPTNHRVHHCWGRKNNYNFAAFTTIYDRAFGTYRSEKEMKKAWQRGEKEEVAVELDWGGKKTPQTSARVRNKEISRSEPKECGTKRPGSSEISGQVPEKKVKVEEKAEPCAR